MVAADIFEKFRKFQQVTYTGVEDFSDRLNFQVTVVLLLVCCTTVTLKTYVLSPVACFIPNEVGSHSGQEQYVNNYCWTEGTFAVPLSEFHIDNALANPTSQYEDRRIIYYQWVPFVLGLQSLFFYLPKVLWGMMSHNRAGTDVGHIIRAANDAVTADSEKHVKLVQHVCKRLEQMLFQNEKLEQKPGHSGLSKPSLLERWRRRIQRNLLLPSRRLGNWLIFTYFVMKLFYTANAIGQLYLMHAFLGFNSTYFAYGAAVFENLRKGRDWTQTMLFPRVGACAVYYRLAGRGNHLFAQCTLPINMINEKIYVFLWFWVLGVAVVTVLSIPMWIWRLVQLRRRASFVKCYLRMSDAWESSGGVDKRDLHRFIRDFLRQDGIFLLRMIALNSGDVVCSEVVQNLWTVYRRRRYGEQVEPEGVVCVPPPVPEVPEEAEQRLLHQQKPPASQTVAPMAVFEKSPSVFQRFISQPGGSGGETRQRPAAAASTVTVEASISGGGPQRKKSATYEAPV